MIMGSLRLTTMRWVLYIRRVHYLKVNTTTKITISPFLSVHNRHLDRKLLSTLNKEYQETNSQEHLRVNIYEKVARSAVTKTPSFISCGIHTVVLLQYTTYCTCTLYKIDLRVKYGYVPYSFR